MVTRICEVCGKEFRTYEAWLRNGKGGRFCSVSCQREGRTRREKTIILATCKECGNEFSRRKGYGGTGEYCSISCMAMARGRLLSGENHPAWKGGTTKRPHSWRSAIKKAIKVSGKCKDCGATDDLQGHHIIPVCVNPDLADSIDNIEVLCSTCHATRHPNLKFIKRINGKEKELDKKGRD